MTDPIRIMRLGIVMFLLLCEAAIDIKKKEISLLISLIVSMLAIALLIFSKDIKISSALVGLLEGFLLMGVSFFTKGQIGYGDGIILCATGLLLGWKDNLTMFFFSCLICAIFSLCLLTIKRADRKTKIPFVPFMVPGFLLTILSTYLS